VFTAGDSYCDGNVQRMRLFVWNPKTDGDLKKA
jgi:hypothetical protein